MTLEQILDDLKSPRIKKVIIDTDTYNEMDDQYAIAYALGSEKMEVIAINAAPFDNYRSEGFADGMEKSYEEIGRVLGVTHRTCPTFRGSPSRIGENPDFGPVDSPAARNIIKEALAADELLYILATGAITNVSSAILMEPAIKDKICVIWLGGNCLENPDLGEFNLAQDYRAGQVIMNCGVNLILLPAIGDGDHGTKMLVTRRDGLMSIKGDSEACVFFRETLPEEFNEEYYENGWERIIWDIAAPAAIAVPDAFDYSIIPAPVFTDGWSYAFDATRHKIIYMERLDPVRIFKDTYESISRL